MNYIVHSEEALFFDWIPAFAGMTGFVGMTSSVGITSWVGMTSVRGNDERSRE